MRFGLVFVWVWVKQFVYNVFRLHWSRVSLDYILYTGHSREHLKLRCCKIATLLTSTILWEVVAGACFSVLSQKCFYLSISDTSRLPRWGWCWRKLQEGRRSLNVFFRRLRHWPYTSWMCVFSFYHCREISSQEEPLALAMVTVLMGS